MTKRIAARVTAPRLQMSLLVMLTAASGFLASAVLSAAGMQALWMRYPLCVVIAYLVFLCLVWAWRRARNFDLPTWSSEGPSPSNAVWHEGGGHSGGGGASASFDVMRAEAASPPLSALPSIDGTPSLDGALELDDSLPVVLVMALLAGALLAVGWVIWIAPALLAELALDAALSAGLYRRIRHQSDGDTWLATTLRHTAWPFVIATASLAVVGIVMTVLAPGVSSLGEFIGR